MRKRRWWSAVRMTATFVVGYVLACMPAQALDTDRSIRQLHHTAWARAAGAPSQTSAIAQANDGFLWIGSSQGLFWFDGIQFVRFEAKNGVQVPSHNTYAIHPVQDGGLWVSFRPSGLGYIRDGNLTLYSRPDEIPETQVYTFANAPDGRLFAGTHRGLAQWDGRRWTDLDDSWGLPDERARRMLPVPRGLLALVGNALWLLPPRAHRFQKVADLPAEPIEMVVDAQGAIWIGFNEGLLRVQPSGDTQMLKLERAAIELNFDRDGGLWVGNDRGLRRIREPNDLFVSGSSALLTSDTFTAADGLSSDWIIHMLEDREGNIWVATVGGIDRFRSNPIVPFALPIQLSSSTIAAADNGAVWVAGITDAAFARVDPQVRGHDQPPSPAGSRPMHVRSVVRARDGTFWWGGHGKLYRQRGEQIDVVPGPSSLTPDWFWDVIAAPTGKGLWVGAGDAGVWHFSNGRWAQAKLPPGMLARVPSASYDDGSGALWFGYTDNRVRVLSGGHVTAYGPDDGLDIGRAKVIRGNAVQRWVGGELGVSFFDGKRFHRIRFADDPQPGAVGGIVATRSGDVWLSEMRGLIRIPTEEVRELLRNPDHIVHAERFDEADGVPGAPQMNTTSSTAIEGTDGVLWFVTDSGLAWVDPKKLDAPPKNPAAKLLGVRSDGAMIPASEAVAFPVGTDRLEFSFTAMTLSAPERVRFRYKLEGFDEHWQNAGTRREAIYSRVPPGNYTFRVMAANRGQEWTGESAALQVSIDPAFWQTPWFVLICALTLVALIAAVYLLRLRQLERQMFARLQERHSERERIARELHDTLLQGIHGLILRFHSIAVQLPADGPLRAAMDRSLDRADDMLIESRDRVSNMRTSIEPVTSLPIGLTRAGQQLAEGYPGQFVHAVQGFERTIDSIVQDDIYQLGREALFNAFKHSGASRIELLMVFDHQSFILRIFDNGRGLDPQIAAGGLPGHWGLAGMRERAERVGSSLSIGPGADGGTSIELVVPARIAYSVSAARRFRDWAFRRATVSRVSK